jgi:hypothetical protein
MNNNIFEELPSRKGGEAKPGADAAAGIEKKARQLVYDSRYEVKKMLAGKRADPASQERMVLGRIAKSTAIPAVKTRARQMVSKKAAVAEDFVSMMEDAAAINVAKAMFKVFVEGVDEVIPDYLEELHGLDDKKYKIRVTDPKTGNSYVRYGTREKITQLRAKGLKVEMTEHGEPREGERKRGEETARATGGGRRSGKKPKLDPVGKEDSDPDNDGKHNDPNDKYIMKRRAAIGKAIATRTEEFLADGTESTEGQNKGKITGKGVDNYASGVVKISPTDGTQSDMKGPKSVYAHTELEGEVLTERAKSRAQQRFMGMVYAAKKGEKPMSPEVASAAKGMTKKEAKKFAKTKHKGLPEKVKEEKECDYDEKKDTRGDYAKVNLIKNKLRSMGAKNPIVMVASEETVEEGMGLSVGASKVLGKVFSNKRTSEAEATKSAQKNITDPVGFAIKGAIGKSSNTGSQQQDLLNKRRPQTPLQKQVAAKTQQVVNQSYELDGKVISEREFDEPGEEDWRPDVRAHNKAVGYRGGYNKYRGSRKPRPENPGPGSQAKPAD